MGGCLSSNDPTVSKNKIARHRNQSIEDRMMEEINQDQHIIRILLLGAGECGKSTILKQMKIIHNNGFSDDDRDAYKNIIRRNTLQSMQTLIETCACFEAQLLHPVNKEKAHKITHYNSREIPCADYSLSDLRDDIHTLWKDPTIQLFQMKGSELNLLDSAPYFLDDVDRIFREQYIPSDQDILHSRVPTTGIIQTEFTIDNLKFRMYDVGGQRGERKRWIHCFESVTAIMFIASLNEYDQVLAEDRTRNRMQESLDLFEGIIELPWFKKAPIILFLNKNDLYQKKITRVDLGIYFSTYNGGLDYEKGLDFIQEQYFLRNDDPHKTIYLHVTDATNTKNIKFVWKCTKHLMLERNLSLAGLTMM